MNTKIKQQELKIYPSEKLTDTDDGGGLRTGTALTGAENELFPPLSGVDVTMGDFAMRLVYAGIDRRDNEPLLGGNFIIATPPDAPNVSFLAFAAAYSGELRQSAVNRVESYSTKTIESRLTLMSTQQQNSRLVVAYQMPDEPIPQVGEIYCLDQEATGYDTVEQYFKVARVTTEERQFYNNRINRYFTRLVVSMETTSPLKANFYGYDGVEEFKADPPCIIRETMVADAGRYYGVKRLAHNAVQNSMNVRVDSIFEKIVPTSQSNTAFADLTASGVSAGLIDATKAGSDGRISIPRHILSYRDGQNVFLGVSVLPGSWNASYGSEVYRDDGNGNIKREGTGVVHATIDYATGVVYLIDSRRTNWRHSYHSFQPAVIPRKIADTAAIAIDETNQSLTHVITIDPAPMKGSLQVSYRAQGAWYNLWDDGSGVLKGVDSKHGSGQINLATSTITLSLGALPDVNSEIIFSWATPATYFNRADIAVEQPTVKFDLANQGIAPNTVTVNYLNGTTPATASDNGSGTITATGFTANVDYANGKVEIIPTTLPNGGAQYEFSYSWGTPLTMGYPSPLRDSSGNIALDLNQTNITPKTVKMVWNVDIDMYDYISTTPAEIQIWNPAPPQAPRPVDPYITTYDDGNGNLRDANNVSYGTINYSTGIINFNPDATVRIPVARYNVVQLGFDRSTVASGERTPVYRNTFRQWEYIPAGASMPVGPTGQVDVWFNAASAANNHTETHTMGDLAIDLTPLYKEPIVEGSAVFTLGGKTYTDRGGKLYYEHDYSTGAGVEAGAINYADGTATISAWNVGQSPAVSLVSLLTTLDKNPVDEVVFRIPQAPVQPQSFQLRGNTLQGNVINVTADADGNISDSNVVGRIDYATGVVRVRFGQWETAAGNEGELWYDANTVVDGRIFKSVPVFADSLIYNAVAYTYLPVDGSIIGIDAARLPSNGEVPIYRTGDMAVVAARYQQDLGTAFTAGQTIQLNVTDLDGLCLVDKNKTHVLAEHYTYDLSAGTITFATPLDLSAYTLPLTAYYAQEEEKAITHVDISGQLTLASPLRRSYDKANSYVSSAMIGGDMQVRTSIPFTQRTWTNVWSDEPIGTPVLEKLNVKDYPIELSDDATITDRWVMVFSTTTRFRLYSERLGLVAEEDILTDLAPLNPANNKPYFRLKKEAFGSTSNVTWPVGRAIRFNTFGAMIMPWIIRAVQRGDNAQTSADGFTMSLRGNTVIE